MASTDEILSELREMRRELKEHTTQLAAACSRIKDHHRTLYGNGQPGMADRLTMLEEKHAACPAPGCWLFQPRAWFALAAVIVAAVGAAAKLALIWR